MPRNGTGDDEGYSNRRYKRNSCAVFGKSANWKTPFLFFPQFFFFFVFHSSVSLCFTYLSLSLSLLLSLPLILYHSLSLCLFVRIFHLISSRDPRITFTRNYAASDESSVIFLFRSLCAFLSLSLSLYRLSCIVWSDTGIFYWIFSFNVIRHKMKKHRIASRWSLVIKNLVTYHTCLVKFILPFTTLVKSLLFVTRYSSLQTKCSRLFIIKLTVT